MSRPVLKDDKEHYRTYLITVRAANKEPGIEEEVVTTRIPNVHRRRTEGLLGMGVSFQPT